MVDGFKPLDHFPQWNENSLKPPPRFSALQNGLPQNMSPQLKKKT